MNMPKWMDRFFHAVGDQINARRLFIKYSCALILPVLVLVLFVQSRYIDQVEGHYQDSLDMYASELAIEMDDVFARIRVTAESIFTDEEILNAYSPNRVADYIKLKESLTRSFNNLDFVSEIYLYCQGDEYLFSNHSSRSFEYFLSIEKFSDVMDEEAFRQLLLTGEKWDVLPSGPERVLLLYPYRVPGKPQKTLIFALNREALGQAFSRALRDNQGEVVMADGQGNALLRQGQTENIRMQSYAASRQTPYSFSLSVESGSLVEGMAALQRLWRLILIATAVLGLLEALLLSWTSILPFRSLRSRLEPAAAQKKGNEYEALCEALDQMQDEMLSLKERSRSVQSHLLEKMLYSQEDAPAALRMLSSAFDLPDCIFSWRVVLIPAMTGVQYEGLLSRLRDVLPSHIIPLLREAGDEGVYALLLADAQENFQQEMPLRDVLKICLHSNRIGMSSACFDSDSLAVAYVQAFIDMKRESNPCPAQPFPEEKKHPLLEAVWQGNAAALRQEMQSYMQKIHAGELEEDAHRLFAVRAMLECRKYAASLHRPFMEWDMAALMEEIHLSPDVWTEMWAGQIFGFADWLGQEEEEEAQPLIDRMCAYVKEQCRAPEFSVQQMADLFQTTPAAVNSLFKKHKGVTAAQYLTEQKMETARNLLINSNLTVYEIGVQLGYFGPNSFIRRFKQTFDMTPGEYRLAYEEKTMQNIAERRRAEGK